MSRHNDTFTSKFRELAYQVRIISLSTLSYFKARLLSPYKHKVMLCYPEMPQMWHMLYSASRYLGYDLTNDPSVHVDLIINYEDTTIQAPNAALDDLMKTRHVINGNCRDISKARVEEVFQKTFGYGTKIDPRVHHGMCVRKSNDNAAHDGKIVECPSEPEPGYIYQKLINNATGTDDVVEIRAYIFGCHCTAASKRYKKVYDRFDNTREFEFTTPGEAFSESEIQQINAFVQAFGLEYGELDVLRDNDDGKIYIVDANKTPGMPRIGVHMPVTTYRKLIKMCAENFAESWG